MHNNKRDTQSDEEQNSESFLSLLQSKKSFLRKKRVAQELFAQIQSFSSRKESEKIVYFDEEFQEVQQLMPIGQSISSKAQNIEKSAIGAYLQQAKNHKKGQKIVETHPKSLRKCKKSTKSPSKNQYDKNIFSNITKVIIKKILDKNCQQLVSSYCILYNVDYAYFIAKLKDLDLQKIRIGTSELKRILLNSDVDPSVKRVLSNFMVHFLQNDFVGYVLQEGRMKMPEKYLRCACKMMYIPQLSRGEFKAMSSLRLGEMQY